MKDSKKNLETTERVVMDEKLKDDNLKGTNKCISEEFLFDKEFVRQQLKSYNDILLFLKEIDYLSLERKRK